MISLYVRGPLAQLAERRSPKPEVVGSSPTGSAMIIISDG
jgi:hypothetical protein